MVGTVPSSDPSSGSIIILSEFSWKSLLLIGLPARGVYVLRAGASFTSCLLRFSLVVGEIPAPRSLYASRYLASLFHAAR